MTAEKGKLNVKMFVFLPLVLAITIFLWAVPTSFFGIEALTAVQQRVIALFVFAALMWIFEIIPNWTTSLLVIVISLLTMSNKGIGFFCDPSAGQLVNYKDLMSAFADPIVMLFLGGFVLAIMAEKYGLDVTLARILLKPFGTRPKMVLLGFLIVIAVFSMFMSNTATAAMMLAFLAPVLAVLPKDDKGRIALALAIPVAANLGGIGTPIGTPPNATAVKFLSEANYDVTFGEWSMRMIPFVIIMIVIAWVFLQLLFPFKSKEIKLEIPENKRKTDWKTYVVWITFIGTILLWATEQWTKINSNVVALIPLGVFTATGLFGKDDIKEINWSVLWLVAGGFALGTCLQGTGLAKVLINAIPFGSMSVVLVLVIAGLVCYFLSNFISNSATAALLIPILIVVAGGMADPEAANNASFVALGGTKAMISFIAVCASIAMLFPISTPPNAIASSTGLVETKDMTKIGLIVGVIGFVLGYFWLTKLFPFSQKQSEAIQESVLEKKAAQYAIVELQEPDLSGISDNGKEVLNLYRFAADEADKIYWEQSGVDKAALDSLDDAAASLYAGINYGPWDRIDGKAFLPGYPEHRPLGGGFYPADMTAEEFEAFSDPAKTSPYTLITRGADSTLSAVWYHDAYKEHIDKICSYLSAAADLTIKPSVRNYLQKKVTALQNDDYYESDLAWIDMADSKMDLVIGPNETADDELYGNKASYGAFVMLKEENKTAALQKFARMLPELQNQLPGDPQYHAMVPGSASNIFDCTAMYYAGSYNAGFKVIALNLPHDPKVLSTKGSRTILFSNIIKEKFNMTVFPLGGVLLSHEAQPHLDADAFYWNIVFREVAHGLGVAETVNGKGSVKEALGAEAETWEKAKDNVLGVYLACYLIGKEEIPALITREDALTTFIASVIRSARFGAEEATGRANVTIYNYLVGQGAIARGANGKYTIDYDKTFEAIRDLGALILKTQATGDLEFASGFAAEHAVIGKDLTADFKAMNLENIPVDIRFTWKK